MSLYEKVISYLQEFDTNPQAPIWDERVIGKAIEALLPREEPIEDFRIWAEIYAFSLIENSDYGKKNWSTFFGPALRDGKETIKLEKINEQILEYWVSRINQVSNPILKARYAGLVKGFSKKILNKNSDFDTVDLVYLDNLIDSCSKKHFSAFSDVIPKLRFALELANTLKKEVLISKAVNQIRSYINSVSKRSSPGIWKYNYELLVQNKLNRAPAPIVEEIIIELESLLNDPEFQIPLNYNSINLAFEQLAEYYSKEGKQTDLNRIFEKLKQIYENNYLSRTQLLIEKNQKDLFNYAKKYGFTTAAKEILLQIQKDSHKNLDGLERQFIEFKIDLAELDTLLEQILSSDETDLLKNLTDQFIPSDQPSSYFGDGVFLQLCSIGLLSVTGRPLATISPDDSFGKIMKNISDNMNFDSARVNLFLKKAADSRVFTEERIIEYLQTSKYITPGKIGIVTKGISAHFKEDYVSALHLIIPQIEAICLAIIEDSEVNTWRHSENRTGGFSVKLFDKTLAEPVFIEKCGENISNYFRSLFTDSRGWNLRNSICHGLMNEDRQDVYKSERVILALLLIAKI